MLSIVFVDRMTNQLFAFSFPSVCGLQSHEERILIWKPECRQEHRLFLYSQGMFVSFSLQFECLLFYTVCLCYFTLLKIFSQKFESLLFLAKSKHDVRDCMIPPTPSLVPSCILMTSLVSFFTFKQKRVSDVIKIL